MSQGSPRPILFDEHLLAPRRDRMNAAFCGGADFLHREIAELVAARLAEVNRPFPDAVIVGSGGGIFAQALVGRIEHPPVQIERSPARARRAGAEVAKTLDPLPLQPASFDLALSCLEMHWLNDPVGHLIQLRQALRPDGLLIAALFGGQTLYELRDSVAEAEVEIYGGLSPRVAPMAEIRDLGALLQRAGFAMPVADSERLRVTYSDPLVLMRELRAMGETNVLADRRRVFLRRAMLERAGEIYTERFSTAEGRIQATFEITFLTGWAPAKGQPEPLRPGSASKRLADALGSSELSAGEPADPRKA